jgi:hypothetical protein
MSRTRPEDVLLTLRQFVDRIDQLDPGAPELGELELGWRGATDRVTIRPAVARALAEALAAYHDPRDYGACAHCGTGRLDSNFLCGDCGIVNGLFGQTLSHFVGGREQPAVEGRHDRPAGR